MNDEQKKMIENIEGLKKITEDSTKGYGQAGDNAKDAELRTLLLRLSQQRKLFAAELADMLRSLGGNPDTGSTTAGTLHRKWLDVKATFTGHDNEAVIDECIRGDRKAVDAYDETLAGHAPDYVKTKLQEQRRLVSGAVDQLKAIKTTVLTH